MSSTPLFDSVARRVTPAPAGAAQAPTSPFSAPVRAVEPVVVPEALIASIDEIPARVTNAIASEYAVQSDELPLVEAVADAITRAVVDAVALELERITRDGVVRA